MNDAPPLNIKAGLIYSAALVALMLLLSAYAWDRLPQDAPIPVHWNAQGQVDRYGSRTEGLLLLPATAAAIALLFAAIPFIEPRSRHLRQSRNAYLALWAAVLALMAAVHLFIVLHALGLPLDPNVAIPIAIGLLFILIGACLAKIRSNFFMGIRTPWTLSSELAWNKTHRLGAKLFLILGLLMLLWPWLPLRQWAAPLILTAALLLLATLVVYSYLVWRNDPDKQPLGRP